MHNFTNNLIFFLTIWLSYAPGSLYIQRKERHKKPTGSRNLKNFNANQMFTHISLTKADILRKRNEMHLFFVSHNWIGWPYILHCNNVANYYVVVVCYQLILFIASCFQFILYIYGKNVKGNEKRTTLNKLKWERGFFAYVTKHFMRQSDLFSKSALKSFFYNHTMLQKCSEISKMNVLTAIWTLIFTRNILIIT